MGLLNSLRAEVYVVQLRISKTNRTAGQTEKCQTMDTKLYWIAQARCWQVTWPGIRLPMHGSLAVHTHLAIRVLPLTDGASLPISITCENHSRDVFSLGGQIHVTLSLLLFRNGGSGVQGDT